MKSSTQETMAIARYLQPVWPDATASDPRLSTRDYNRGLSDDEFVYGIDDNGVYHLTNPPEDLGRFYPVDYHNYPHSLADYEPLGRAENYKVAMIQRFVRSGKLLEIGPSIGAFLFAAKASGFDVSAIEMSEKCCGLLRDIVGATVYRSDDPLDQLEKSDQTYDVIAMWHSLEHMRQPALLFAAAARRLSPRGILILAMPNPEAVQFRLLGKYWAHVDAPRHLFLLPVSFMKSLAANMGLKFEMVTTRDFGSIFWNRFGWAVSLSNFGRRPLLRRLLGLLGKVISVFLAPLEGREGFGSAYTIVFRKPESD